MCVCVCVKERERGNDGGKERKMDSCLRFKPSACVCEREREREGWREGGRERGNDLGVARDMSRFDPTWTDPPHHESLPAVHRRLSPVPREP